MKHRSCATRCPVAQISRTTALIEIKLHPCEAANSSITFRGLGDKADLPRAVRSRPARRQPAAVLPLSSSPVHTCPRSFGTYGLVGHEKGLDRRTKRSRKADVISLRANVCFPPSRRFFSFVSLCSTERPLSHACRKCHSALQSGRFHHCADQLPRSTAHCPFRPCARKLIRSERLVQLLGTQVQQSHRRPNCDHASH